MTLAEAAELAKALTFIAAIWIAGAVLLVGLFIVTFFAARFVIDLILDLLPWHVAGFVPPLALLLGGTD